VRGVLPIVGPIFARTGILGVWITALLLAWGITRYGEVAVRARRDRAALRRLEAVDNPHNHGKAGALLLAQGRASKALPHLTQAAEGEPDSAEWSYRLGLACMRLGHKEQAVAALRDCVGLDEEYAYGSAQARLAEALLAVGRAEEALAALERMERNHGPSPESAFRSAGALRALGRREEGTRRLLEVSRLASEAPKFQRSEAQTWVLRAWFARLF
jgi:tetratricopeptide (TPR) repeat protein